MENTKFDSKGPPLHCRPSSDVWAPHGAPVGRACWCDRSTHACLACLRHPASSVLWQFVCGRARGSTLLSFRGPCIYVPPVVFQPKKYNKNMRITTVCCVTSYSSSMLLACVFCWNLFPHNTPTLTAYLLLYAVSFFCKVDKIVVMGQLPGAEGATIVDQGTYEELVGRGRDLSNILEEQKTKEKQKPAEAEVWCRACVRTRARACVCVFFRFFGCDVCMCTLIEVSYTYVKTREGKCRVDRQMKQERAITAF